MHLMSVCLMAIYLMGVYFMRASHGHVPHRRVPYCPPQAPPPGSVTYFERLRLNTADVLVRGSINYRGTDKREEYNNWYRPADGLLVAIKNDSRRSQGGVLHWSGAAFYQWSSAGDSWLEELQSPSFPLSLPLVGNHCHRRYWNSQIGKVLPRNKIWDYSTFPRLERHHLSVQS
jgi:hypothetical protein